MTTQILRSKVGEAFKKLAMDDMDFTPNNFRDVLDDDELYPMAIELAVQVVYASKFRNEFMIGFDWQPLSFRMREAIGDIYMFDINRPIGDRGADLANRLTEEGEIGWTPELAANVAYGVFYCNSPARRFLRLFRDMKVLLNAADIHR